MCVLPLVVWKWYFLFLFFYCTLHIFEQVSSVSSLCCLSICLLSRWGGHWYIPLQRPGRTNVLCPYHVPGTASVCLWVTSLYLQSNLAKRIQLPVYRKQTWSSEIRAVHAFLANSGKLKRGPPEAAGRVWGKRWVLCHPWSGLPPCVLRVLKSLGALSRYLPAHRLWEERIALLTQVCTRK